MLVVMQPGASAAELDRVAAALAARGLNPRRVEGEPAVLATPDSGPADEWAALAGLPGVDRVITGSGYPLASRAWRPEGTRIAVGGVVIGGDEVVLIAGPCAVESESQILRTARQVAALGGRMLRGGAFKPRTSPYAFQGLENTGLRLLARAREATGLAIVTEALDEAGVDPVAEVADVIQIGSRSMGNTALLRRAAATGRPILLKRGMAATVEELLWAAEYVLAEGNPNVMLCERGVRGFDGATRNLFDLAAIPLLRTLTHLPLVADPSHGTGRRDLVPAMAKAAVAAGADALLIEVHPEPEAARSDGPQSLDFDAFAALVEELRPVAEAVGRTFGVRAADRA